MLKGFFSGCITILDFLSERSGFRKLAGVTVAKIEARLSEKSWVPNHFVSSNVNDPEILKKLVLHLHVYHQHYVERAREIISDFPDAGRILITSPFEEVLQEFRSVTTHPNLELRLVRNVGRNFGAIKQIVPTISDFEYLLHLHSKVSKHMSLKRSAEWSRLYWNTLANRANVIRILNIMDSDSRITVSYPDLTNVLPSSAFGWGSNKNLAQALLAESKVAQLDGQIAFPAGGMFVCRAGLILDLMTRIGLDDFPREPFPVDGSVAHALERLMGVHSMDGQPVHLVLSSQGLLTTDTSYKSHKGVWG